MWFPTKKPDDQTELLIGVAVKRGLFGRCLEIKSRDPKRWRWLCAPNLTLRFFFRNPEDVEKIILDAMHQKGTANQASEVTVRKLAVPQR